MALTTTLTLSPFLSRSSFRESSVITELIAEPAGTSSVTWHIKEPFLMAVIFPISWLRAPYFITSSNLLSHFWIAAMNRFPICYKMIHIIPGGKLKISEWQRVELPAIKKGTSSPVVPFPAPRGLILSAFWQRLQQLFAALFSAPIILRHIAESRQRLRKRPEAE
jgi:hypothetical protein